MLQGESPIVVGALSGAALGVGSLAGGGVGGVGGGGGGGGEYPVAGVGVGAGAFGIGMGMGMGMGGVGMGGGVGLGGATAAVAAAAAKLNAVGVAGLEGLGRNPALHLTESIRSALRASPSGVGGVGAGVGVVESGSANKRGCSGLFLRGGINMIYTGRRVGTSASIKLSTTPSRRRSASPATTGAGATSHTHQRSRLSRQVLPPEESEEEAEAEENAEEMEDVDAEEDDKIYCFCRKKSFGDVSRFFSLSAWFCVDEV